MYHNQKSEEFADHPFITLIVSTILIYCMFLCNKRIKIKVKYKYNIFLFYKSIWSLKKVIFLSVNSYFLNSKTMQGNISVNILLDFCKTHFCAIYSINFKIEIYVFRNCFQRKNCFTFFVLYTIHGSQSRWS